MTARQSIASSGARHRPRTGVGQAAISAKAFLNSLGINTHASQGYDYNNYITPLQYTGIANVRDGAGAYTALVAIFNQTGVKANVLLGGYITSADIANGITNWIKPLAQMGALVSIEGANEPNNEGVNWNGVQGGNSISWVPVAQEQAALYAAIKADPVLQVYPVYQISEGGGQADNVGLQYLAIPPSGSGVTLMPAGTVYADYANCHNYVSGTQGTYSDNQAWLCADPTAVTVFDGLPGNYGLTWGNHYVGYSNTQLLNIPRVTTETGIDSTVSPWTQRLQGVALVNCYLAQFKRGWAYTYIYELVDQEGSANNQGIYTTGLAPKLAATYIHNMTTILADTAIKPVPGFLNYSIASQPTTVHDMLLQKANGTFELCVWGESVSGSFPITVALGATFSTVKVYDVTSGTTPVSTLSNVSSVALTMTDHAFIIEI